MTTASSDGIAIIGLAGRFPGARDAGRFWSNLVQARESISRFSASQLQASGVPLDEINDPAYVPCRAILDQPEWFDAAFFEMTPREADLTDPQHRVFLECCWEAFEDAGIAPRNGTRNVAVFAAASLNTYFLRQVLGNSRAIADFTKIFQADGYNLLLGADKDYLATRVSHKLDLRGPAMTIQTACSSSLVAIAQAVASLQTYQCDMALAGGVSISFPQERGHIHQEGAIPSSDGHCRTFDAKASGTVFGAGCGVLLLKRLDEALRDNDPVHAVLKSVALNNDGAKKLSYSAPSQDGQAEVIALAHALAGIHATDISYVEAHGTATPVGDPIEVAALTQAFRTTSDEVQTCGLGSVKTNLGHLEAASGAVALIKVALALENRFLPASLHFSTANPDIDFAHTPFRVVAEGRPWENVPLPRRAGVSSFGVGGTNAHAIVEEAPAREPANSNDSPQLLVLSASTSTALEATANRLASWLESVAAASNPSRLVDVTHTLQQGRTHFEHRRSLVVSTVPDAIEKLREPFPHRPALKKRAAPEVVFMFPGQGAQYVGMAHELHDSEPVFRHHVDECLNVLGPDAGLAPLLLNPAKEGDASRERLLQTSITQPALFIVEYALAKLWMSWGVQPAACVGHSLGEYVAAVLAGVLTLKDGLQLLAERARLMQSMPGGAMLSVRLAEGELAPRLKGSLSLAAVNSTRLCVVSGTSADIAEFRKVLEQERIACRVLLTSHAFHSAMMDPVIEPFTAIVRRLSLAPAQIPLLSTVSGRWMESIEWTEPGYWARQLRQPVRFADAVTTLFERKDLILLEVGPGQTLFSLAQQRKDRPEQLLALASLPPVGDSHARPTLLGTLGELWGAGVEVDWSAIGRRAGGRRISLPTYPFERRRHWIEPAVEPADIQSSVSIPPTNGSVEATIFAQLEQMRSQLVTLAHSPER